MSVYRCAICDRFRDDDWNPGSEWGNELICEGCITEVGDEFSKAKGRDEKDDAELYEWAKDNF